MTFLRHVFGAYLGQLLPEHADLLTDYARNFAEDGIRSTAADFVRSLETAGSMYATFGPIMERFDVFICPTNALSAVPADFRYQDALTINGKPVNPMLGWVMTTPFNTLSRCPVLSVPSGRASNGVPTGIQIVGGTYRDADVFRAGLAYEEAVGGWFAAMAARPEL